MIDTKEDTENRNKEQDRNPVKNGKIARGPMDRSSTHIKIKKIRNSHIPCTMQEIRLLPVHDNRADRSAGKIDVVKVSWLNVTVQRGLLPIKLVAAVVDVTAAGRVAVVRVSPATGR